MDNSMKASRGQLLLAAYASLPDADPTPTDAIADILHAVYQMHDAHGDPVEAQRAHDEAWGHFATELAGVG